MHFLGEAAAVSAAMNRLALKIILIVVILALCFYSQHEYSKRHSSIPDIKEDPDRYENVSFRSEGVVENVRVDGGLKFTIVVMGDPIDAIYPNEKKLEGGDYVIVYGILHMKSGYLEVTDLHIYKDIRRLYVLSVVGLGLLLFLFFRDWRFSADRFEWRHRYA